MKVSSVTWGVFNEDESKTCTRGNLIRDDYFIKEGDFLISRANTIELVGACVVVGHTSRTLMLSDKILRLSFVESWAAWLLWTLRSFWGREEIERLATGNQESMRNISQANLRRIRVPLPPAKEAERIVRSIEAGLSIADQGRTSAGANALRCARLRQSILKWASRAASWTRTPPTNPRSACSSASRLSARPRAASPEAGNEPGDSGAEGSRRRDRQAPGERRSLDRAGAEGDRVSALRNPSRRARQGTVLLGARLRGLRLAGPWPPRFGAMPWSIPWSKRSRRSSEPGTWWTVYSMLRTVGSRRSASCGSSSAARRSPGW